MIAKTLELFFSNTHFRTSENSDNANTFFSVREHFYDVLFSFVYDVNYECSKASGVYFWGLRPEIKLLRIY